MMTRKVLAVDDSPTVRQMLSFTLQDAGYEVMEAVDGCDALEKLSGKGVDLLITDLNMPRLDGLGLIREVRKNPAHRFLPILMLTTESQEAKKDEGRTAGATGWIVKPFRPEQLLAVVGKVLK